MKKHYRIAILLFTVDLGLLMAQDNFFVRTWNDLNAYFNTYYNAKVYFKSAQSLYEQEEDKSQLSVQTRSALNKAIQQAELVKRKFPQSSYVDDVMFYNSVCQYYLGRYELAIEELESLTLRYPDSRYYYEAKLWISKSYFEVGRKTLAYDLLQQFLENSGNRAYFSDAYSLMGNLALQEHDSSKALQSFIRAADQSSRKEQRCNMYLEAVNILIDKEQYDDALKYTDRANRSIKFDEQRARVSLAYVRIYRKKGNIEKAQEHIDDALKDARIASYWGDIIYEEAQLCFDKGDDEDAVQKLRLIVRDSENVYRNSRESKAWVRSAFRLGNYFLYENTDLDSSEFYFKRAQTKRRQVKEGEIANDYVVKLTQLKQVNSSIRQHEKNNPELLESPAAHFAALQDSMLTESAERVALLQDTLQADSTIVDSLIRSAESKTRHERKLNDFKKAAIAYTDDLLNAAGLFLFELNFPDTAIRIYRNIGENFDFIPITPQALYSQAYVHEHHYDQKEEADSIKQLIAERFPESEFTDFILNRVSGDSLLYYRNQDRVFEIETQYLDKKEYRQGLKLLKELLNDPAMDPKNAALITYKIAWIYDHELSREEDTKDSTLHYYHLLSQNHPDTPLGKKSTHRLAVIETNLDNYQAFLAGDSLAMDSDESIISNGMIDMDTPADSDKRKEHPIVLRLESPARPRPERL
jgi:tetratricopeptide (TPR) repeat protein